MSKKNSNFETKAISAIKAGAIDPNGNIIIEVLSKGNEFAIYEIKTDDTSSVIRVFISGHTFESDTILINRYANVKHKFIEARGLLYRSNNFNMMKSMVASTLATALCRDNDEVKTNELFNKLIHDINDQYKRVISCRIHYLTIPVFVLFSLALLLFAHFKFTNRDMTIPAVLFGSMLGGVLSMLISIKKHKFDSFLSAKFYYGLGFERTMLACIAGGITYVLIKSGYILNSIVDFNNPWSVMPFIIIAGFSESFIPGFLENESQKLNE